MAVNEVQLTISVGDNGSLGVVAKKADAAAKATGKLGKSTKDLGKVSDTTYRTLQGTAGTSSNLTKNFAKQAQGIEGGLVPAYATLAANVFAITAAFGALQRAAQVEQLIEGFTFLANISGRTATLVAENLVKITDSALSMEQALRAASAGMSAGFNTTELEGLAQVAKNAAQALGRDVGDATDRLIRGVGKLEPEILDELGIFVKLEPAAQKYAASLGRSVTSLTETERRQAFLNAALEQGEKKFGSLTGQVDVNPFDKLAASFADLTKIFFNFVNQGLGPIVSFFANNMVALTGAVIMFGSTVVRQMLPVLDQIGIKAADAAEKTFLAAEKTKKAAEEGILAKSGELAQFKTKLPKKNIYNELKPSIIANTASNEDLDKSIKAVTRTISGKEAALQKSTTKNIAKIKQETQALKEELSVLMQVKAARSGDSRAFQEVDIAETKALGAAIAADKAEAVQNADGVIDAFSKARSGFKDYKKEIGDAFQKSKSLAGGRLGKALVSIKFGFEKAAVGARLFGIALINAIPFIGQIITIGGIALGFLSQWFGRTTAVSEAQKELNTVLETAAEKVEQFEREVARLEAISTAQTAAATAGEIYANTLRIQAGFQDEFTSSLQKLTNAIIEEDVSEKGFFASLFYFVQQKTLEKISQAIQGFKDVIDATKEALNNIGTAFLNNPVFEFLGITDGVKALSQGVDSVTESLQKSGKETELTRKINDKFATAMEEGGVMAARLREEFGDDGSGFIAAVKKATKEEGSFEAGLQKTLDTLKESTDELKVQSGNVDSLGESFSELSQTLVKFREAEAKKDKFATVAEEIEGRINLLKRIQTEAGEDGPSKFAEIVASRIEDGTLNLEQFGITTEEVTEDVIGNLESLADHFREISELQTTIKDKQARLKLDANLVKARNAAAQAGRELKNMVTLLETFGKKDFAGLDYFNSVIEKQKEMNAQIQKEFETRTTIAALNFRLDYLRITAEMKLNSENAERIAALQEELAVKAQLLGISLETLAAERDAARIRNQISGIQGQDQSNTAFAGALQGAQSFADAIELFSAKLAENEGSFSTLFDIVDEKGETVVSGATQRVDAVQALFRPLSEEFKKLGPGGEVFSTFMEGIDLIVDSIQRLNKVFDGTAQGIRNIQKVMSEAKASGDLDLAEGMKLAETATRVAAVTAAIAASFSALFATMAAGTRNRIAGVDQEIEAEKKRDGKSKESVARLAQLEKKKDALKRKEFEQNKKAQMAQIVMATALGVAQAIGMAFLFPFNFVLAGLIGAMGAAQLAIVAGTSYQGGASGAGAGAGGAPTSVSAGQRRDSVDIAKSQSSRGEIAYMRGESGIGGPENFRPAFGGYKNRAEGGSAAFMVGEQGPELFVPERPGRIVPNDDISAPAPSNVTFNINTVDATGVETLLTQQRGNIIGMVREAANSYGQDFIEEVDTSVFTQNSIGVSRY